MEAHDIEGGVCSWKEGKSELVRHIEIVAIDPMHDAAKRDFVAGLEDYFASALAECIFVGGELICGRGGKGWSVWPLSLIHI